MTNPNEHPDFCWSHRVVEKQGFLRCGECMHWFTDEAELVRDYNEGLWAVGLDYADARTIEAIFFCPHCAHDF